MPQPQTSKARIYLVKFGGTAGDASETEIHAFADGVSVYHIPKLEIALADGSKVAESQGQLAIWAPGNSPYAKQHQQSFSYSARSNELPHKIVIAVPQLFVPTKDLLHEHLGTARRLVWAQDKGQGFVGPVPAEEKKCPPACTYSTGLEIRVSWRWSCGNLDVFCVSGLS